MRGGSRSRARALESVARHAALTHGTIVADAVIDLRFSGQTTDGGETGGRHPRRHCRPGYRRHHNGCNTCRRPEPRCMDIRCLPIVTDECFTISRRCLDLIDEVRFGSRVLAEGGTLGDGGWAVSEDGRELEICPPHCLLVAT